MLDWRVSLASVGNSSEAGTSIEWACLVKEAIEACQEAVALTGCHIRMFNLDDSSFSSMLSGRGCNWASQALQ